MRRGCCESHCLAAILVAEPCEFSIAGISAYGVHTVYVAYVSPDGLCKTPLVKQPSEQANARFRGQRMVVDVGAHRVQRGHRCNLHAVHGNGFPLGAGRLLHAQGGSGSGSAGFCGAWGDRDIWRRWREEASGFCGRAGFVDGELSERLGRGRFRDDGDGHGGLGEMEFRWQGARRLWRQGAGETVWYSVRLLI